MSLGNDPNFDVDEKVNVLFKDSMGFPTTQEAKPWFQETAIKYNNYTVGERIFLDEIPSNPTFDVEIVDPTVVGLLPENFSEGGKIIEDRTRTIRYYKRLKLNSITGSGNNSYYLLDTAGNNVLTDGLQFNTKWSGSGAKPYPYELTSQLAIEADPDAPETILQDKFGGNWFYDFKSGAIFFPDYLQSIVDNTTNKPVFSFYKYIGRKGINKLIEISDSQPPDPFKDQILLNTDSKKLQLWNGLTWDDYGGGLIPESKVNTAGQTFTQLLTEQPNMFDSISTSSSSTLITITWDYSSIIPLDENGDPIKLSQGNVKSRCLPFINKIKIEVNESDDETSWIPLDFDQLQIGDDSDYNTDTFKKVTILKSYLQGKITTDNSFRIRVFGINYDDLTNPGATGVYDIPSVTSRALIFTGLKFVDGVRPSQPQYKGPESITGGNGGYILKSIFYVDETEKDNEASGAKLNKYETSATEANTKRSTIYELDESTRIKHGAEFDAPGIAAQEDFQVQIGKTLKAGTSYNYYVNVTNDVTDELVTSADSLEKSSVYTPIPNSDDIGTLLDFAKSTTNTHVTSDNLDDDSIIYLVNEGTVFYLNNAIQIFEITKPYSETLTDKLDEGYGKYVDQKDDLVIVSVKNNTSGVEEKIQFNGFISDSYTVTPSDTTTLTYFEKNEISASDIYSSSNINKGFRLKGQFRLKNLSASSIGGPRKDPHELEYTYSRDDVVGGVDDSTTTHTIYIDKLTSGPISNELDTTEYPNSTIVKSVALCMGIPSVKTFDVQLSRQYTNINSEYMFIHGDKRIAQIKDVDKTSITSQNYTLNQGAISDSGSYEKTYSWSDIHYNSSIFGETYLYIDEDARSLYSTHNLNNVYYIVVYHFCDKSSFSDTPIDTPSVSIENLYEIQDITDLNVDLSLMTTLKYQDHGTVIKPWTLLYIGGNFASNGSRTYPYVKTFIWGEIDIPETQIETDTGTETTTYKFGDYAYSIKGIREDSSGYKWIVFNGKDQARYYQSPSGAQTYYYNIKAYLSGLEMSSNVINKLKDTNDDDVIGFVRWTPDDDPKVGNLSLGANVTNLWYQLSTAVVTNATLENIQDPLSSFGCAYTDGDNWGAIVSNKYNTSEGIFIFIAFKNTVPLF